ncbi:hypothetical protein CLF_108775 [Clonorchis sinensis]|uniref:Uncharacterized protein n=1 Tax=Clonorchis sinensis TaxID=79923 RepID=G7YII0_CLOSI|nr:hypothetical protein CLF_108775 [Clonorchis sinensis]
MGTLVLHCNHMEILVESGKLQSGVYLRNGTLQQYDLPRFQWYGSTWNGQWMLYEGLAPIQKKQILMNCIQLKQLGPWQPFFALACRLLDACADSAQASGQLSMAGRQIYQGTLHLLTTFRAVLVADTSESELVESKVPYELVITIFGLSTRLSRYDSARDITTATELNQMIELFGLVIRRLDHKYPQVVPASKLDTMREELEAIVSHLYRSASSPTLELLNSILFGQIEAVHKTQCWTTTSLSPTISRHTRFMEHGCTIHICTPWMFERKCKPVLQTVHRIALVPAATASFIEEKQEKRKRAMLWGRQLDLEAGVARPTETQTFIIIIKDSNISVDTDPNFDRHCSIGALSLVYPFGQNSRKMQTVRYEHFQLQTRLLSDIIGRMPVVFPTGPTMSRGPSLISTYFYCTFTLNAPKEVVLAAPNHHSLQLVLAYEPLTCVLFCSVIIALRGSAYFDGAQVYGSVTHVHYCQVSETVILLSVIETMSSSNIIRKLLQLATDTTPPVQLDNSIFEYVTVTVAQAYASVLNKCTEPLDSDISSHVVTTFDRLWNDSPSLNGLERFACHWLVACLQSLLAHPGPSRRVVFDKLSSVFLRSPEKVHRKMLETRLCELLEVLPTICSPGPPGSATSDVCHWEGTGLFVQKTFYLVTLPLAKQINALSDALGISSSTEQQHSVEQLKETRIQVVSTVVELTTPSLSTRFRLRSSDHPETATAGCAGVGIILTHRVEGSLLVWIPGDTPLCAVHLATSTISVDRRENIKDQNGVTIVNKDERFDRLPNNKSPTNYHWILQVKVDGKPGTPYGVEGWPLSPLIINFLVDEIMRQTLEDLQNPGVQVASDDILVDLECADDVVLVFEEEEKAQLFLDELTRVIPSFDMPFALTKYEILLLDIRCLSHCIPPPVFAFAYGPIGTTFERGDMDDVFACLPRLLESTAGQTSDKMGSGYCADVKIRCSGRYYPDRRFQVKTSLNTFVYC